MGVILTSVSGGVADPYIGSDGVDAGNTFPHAGFETDVFVDRVTITPDAGNSITALSIILNASTDNQLSLSNITDGPLNVTYATVASSGAFSNITYSVNTSNTNVTFSGTITNAFTDLYWDTMNLTTMTSVHTNTVPDYSGDTSLYLYKPSFCKYTTKTYTIATTQTGPYGTGNVNYTVLKRVLNLWDINRVILKNIVSTQDAYRQATYPKGN